MWNKDIVSKLAASYDSFYLYDESVIREKAAYLKKQFPGVKFLYSMKCNSHREVLKTIFDENFGADAASLGEVLTARELGLKKEEIYYSAPGKMDQDIEAAIDKAILIADSLEEIYRLEKIAKKQAAPISIGIRVNPNFTLEGDVCLFNKFGIDEEQVDSYLNGQKSDYIKVTGIHVHLKSQELSTSIMERYYKKTFELAAKYSRLTGGLEYVNLGSGMGVEYAVDDTPIDVKHLGKTVQAEMNRFRRENPDTQILIETGRYVTCKSGIYVTKVIDRKVSCGKTFLIAKNTLNGFAKPSFEQLFTRYGGLNAPAAEPLFTRNHAFQFETLKDGDGEPKETVSIFGNLCTPNDVIATDIELPPLEYGDVIIANNAGSYAAVITPMQFSTQEKPVELFLDKDGSIKLQDIV